MTIRIAALMVCGILVSASTASAQRPASTKSGEPAVSLRAFGMGTYQAFAARQTFKATLNGPEQPFFGGGLDVTFRGGLFIDLTASRFSRTGQRAFFLDGQSFRLGIPLTVKEIPLEFSGGYRFRRTHVLQPYVGAGVGSYRYNETSSDSPASTATDDVDVRHAGYLLVGGVEARFHPWLAVSADAQWTRISGILGTGGVSKDANENDLGGVAARVRVIVGK